MEHRTRRSRLGRWLLVAGLATLGAPPALAAPPTGDLGGKARRAVQSRTADRTVGPYRLLRSVKAPARDFRAEGYRLLREGDREGALAAFEKAVKREPDALELWRLIGDLHYALGHPIEAVRSWVRGLELSPRHPGLLDRIARGASEVGDFELATQAQARLVDVLGDALAEHPEARGGELDELFRRHLAIYAELAVLAGDFTTGEKAARRLIRYAPDRVDGRLALAYVHLQAAEYAEAEALYREVLAVEPQNTVALNNLGNIEYMYREFDAAAALFERILSVPEVKPYSESIALANLGELVQLQGGVKDAEMLYQAAIETMPEGAWGYMGLASLYDQIGEYDRAIEAMIEGWERDQSRITRLNMHFYTEEWAWQRDALIAEIEGDIETARKLWNLILHGDVPALYKSAAHHLHSLALVED